jgi:cytochrome c oxidase cbb3-type subunit 3
MTVKGALLITIVFLSSLSTSISIISCTKNEEKEKEEKPEESEVNKVEVSEEIATEAKGEDDITRGKHLYNEKCANCHGPTGHGDGPQAAFLNPKPTNLNDEKYMSTLTDEHIFKTISEGGIAVGKSNLMPRWKFVLSKSDISHVIAYIKRDICKCEYKGK